MFHVTLNLGDYPDDELQALKSEAARRGLSLGHLAREILLQYATTAPAPAAQRPRNPMPAEPLLCPKQLTDTPDAPDIRKPS